MALWKPDPTFYPSPSLAMKGPPETLAYVAAFNPNKDGRPDVMTVVDVAPDSPAYGQRVGQVEMPQAGDELHHLAALSGSTRPPLVAHSRPRYQS